MDSKAFRKSQGWSQAKLGERLGVRARSFICQLENGTQPWPLRLALKYEQLSDGLVKAADLCPEARELLPAPAGAEARA